MLARDPILAHTLVYNACCALRAPLFGILRLHNTPLGLSLAFSLLSLVEAGLIRVASLCICLVAISNHTPPTPALAINVLGIFLVVYHVYDRSTSVVDGLKWSGKGSTTGARRSTRVARSASTYLSHTAWGERLPPQFRAFLHVRKRPRLRGRGFWPKRALDLGASSTRKSHGVCWTRLEKTLFDGLADWGG